MTEIPKGFVPIKQVAEQFNISRSTLDRRRVKAQQGSEQGILKHFILRTRDGEVHEAPSREQVQQFIKDGLVPEWFVSKAWLRKEYGERQAGEASDAGQPSTPGAGESTAPDPVIAALKDRIDDLKQQLQQEKEEKRELLQYAQHDKQLFGNAVSNLTKVLTLPGVAGAIDTANRQLTQSTANEPPKEKRGESAPDKPSPQKPRPAPKPSGKGKKQPAKKKGWFGWRRR